MSTDSYDQLLQSLPPSLRAIIEALGLATAIIFLNKKGGQHVYIPKCQNEEWHGLTPEQLIDLRRHLHDKRIDNHLPSLINDHGGITLPKADKILIRLRDSQIRKSSDKQRNQLAADYQLSVRQVWNILNDQQKTAVDQAEIPWD